jgi:hypothetical protein
MIILSTVDGRLRYLCESKKEESYSFPWPAVAVF